MVARPKSHGGRFRQTEGTSLSFYHRLTEFITVWTKVLHVMNVIEHVNGVKH